MACDHASAIVFCSELILKTPFWSVNRLFVIKISIICRANTVVDILQYAVCTYIKRYWFIKSGTFILNKETEDIYIWKWLPIEKTFSFRGLQRRSYLKNTHEYIHSDMTFDLKVSSRLATCTVYSNFKGPWENPKTLAADFLSGPVAEAAKCTFCFSITLDCLYVLVFLDFP